MRKQKLPLILAAFMVSGFAMAQEKEKEKNIDEVVLIGSGSST